MTDRTSGKSINYKLFSTQGVRKVVDREPRSSTRGTLQEKSAVSIDLSGSLPSFSNQELVSVSPGSRSFKDTPTRKLPRIPVDHQNNDISVSVATSFHTEYSENNDSDNHSQSEEEDVFNLEVEEPEVADQFLDIRNMAQNQETSLAADIDDFVGENPLPDISQSICDLDDVVRAVESLRSAYRNKHNEVVNAVGVENISQEDKKSYDDRISMIKDYILEAKKYRKAIRDVEVKVKSDAENLMKQKLTFLSEEVDRLMTVLENKFCEEFPSETNEELTRRKNDLPEHSKDINIVAKSIQDVVSAGESDEKVSKLRQRYSKLLNSKSSYVDLVHKEFDKREIEKSKSFKKSNLGIKLKPFQGYGSVSDVYTFQDEFEKLHLRDTPSDSLADLLKNNYLEGPAKLLVRDVIDIDEIWSKLKTSYGDQKLLLSKKLQEVNQVEVSAKNKDSVEVLSKIVNLVKDLLRLAKRHSIENNLYYGDGLNQICHLLGSDRRRRWLELACNIKNEGERWVKMEEFLDKELRVSQQEAIIMNKPLLPKSNRES